MTTTTVYAVHTVRADEVRPTKFISTDMDAAERYAADMSTDPNVLAAAVTSFVLNEPGTRRGVSLFVDGVKQARPYVSDNRKINS
jgi:hypothetical protein